MVMAEHARAHATVLENDLQTAVKRFLSRVHTVEDRKRRLADHGLPRLRTKVYSGSHGTQTPAGLGDYGGSGGNISAAVPEHLPAAGRYPGPIGFGAPEKPQTLPAFFEMVRIADAMCAEISEKVGIDVLHPNDWEHAVRKKVREYKNEISVNKGLSEDEFRQAVLEYLIIWERMLAYELPDICATLVALRWNWNIETFNRVHVQAAAAIEVVADEIETLGYNYADIPIWSYKDGLKLMISGLGRYAGKEGAAATAAGPNRADRTLARNARRNALTKHILSSDYGINWHRAISINEKELAYMCLEGLRRQMGFYDGVGRASNPLVNPVVSGAERELQLTFDRRVYTEDKELDWWKERYHMPHGFE